MKIRVGKLQIPPILDVPVLYTGNDHRAIGVRCPKCQKREVVYNGNYFCSGFDQLADTRDCDWALPDTGEVVIDPETGRTYDTDPHFWDFEDLIVNIGCAGGRRGSRW